MSLRPLDVAASAVDHRAEVAKPKATLRWGLFLQMDGAPPGATVYRQGIELIKAGEDLGAYSARVTQHHFGERYGWLPSPLPFLAAVGQVARQIRLGTVVITIPLEQPLRVAEEAAVTDHLLQGRLELGFGSGLNQAVFTTLRADYNTRREVTRQGLAIIQAALRGEPLDERGTRLQPPAPDLAERLWFAVMSREGAEYAAEHNLGLLLGRVEHGAGSPVANQSQTTQIYREAVKARGDEVRIAAGRTIYPAADRATAERDLAEALQPLREAYVQSGFMPAGATFQELLARLHIIYGHPEEIIETLRREQAAIGWTELLVQVDPGNLPHAKSLKALELLADKVLPYLDLEENIGASTTPLHRTVQA